MYIVIYNSVYVYVQFKCAQEVFELKGREANLSADIQGGRATLRNLGSQQNKLDEETLKQQEILYTQVSTVLHTAHVHTLETLTHSLPPPLLPPPLPHSAPALHVHTLDTLTPFLLLLHFQDFQLQQLQHRLNRLEGERTDDEKLALDNRIKVSNTRHEHNYMASPIHSYIHTHTRYIHIYTGAGGGLGETAESGGSAGGSAEEAAR